MALRPFYSRIAALRIAAVTLFFTRTLYGRAQVIFFSVYIQITNFSEQEITVKGLKKDTALQSFYEKLLGSSLKSKNAFY